MHWRRKWQPTPVFLPGESQGWGSLVGCCLWGHTESDTTEVTYQQQQSKREGVYVNLQGGGHGNPAQYSCLENPTDRGVWQAAVHGVAESQTQLSDFHFSLPCIGEGNGNPLQYSCLENPRDWGAWWATVYGVEQSRTRLK